MIPGSGRYAGEGIGYRLWYSWASLGSTERDSACNTGDLGFSQHWEDPLEEGMATHSSMLFLCWCNCLLNGLIARNSESSQGFPDSSVGKEFAKEETPVQFLGQEDPLEKG